jgi:hypothetical protein
VPKWNLAKSENKQHNADDTETVTYEATIRLDADDPAEPVTLGDIATLVGALTTVDGIPEAALLGNSIDVALRWTDDDL